MRATPLYVERKPGEQMNNPTKKRNRHSHHLCSQEKLGFNSACAPQGSIATRTSQRTSYDHDNRPILASECVFRHGTSTPSTYTVKE